MKYQNKIKLWVGLVLGIMGATVLCPPSMYAVDQGSRPYDQEVAGSFKSGQCKHVGISVACDFTDAATGKKWAQAMEKKVKELEIEAGKPMSILGKVCRDKGFTDADCPKILAAMAQQESYFGKEMVGDGGQSHGWFHIMYYHNVPKSCSEDLKCSAAWTLGRMVAKGFATNRDNAIRLHNGGLANPKTAAYLALVKSKMNLF